LALQAPLESDCQPLSGLVQAMLAACANIRCMRDATRGGVATVVNEIAQASGTCVRLSQDSLPLRESVAGIAELLGLDPLYLANEGKLVAVVPRDAAPSVLAAMRANAAGRDAAIIGEIAEDPAGVVTLVTPFGGERVVDMLVGEQLPRIC
jgi:hydrogenase expression/formation protein HypE